MFLGFTFTGRNRSLQETLRPGGADWSRIRCPRCGWRPRREDQWCCSPGCQHVWNTFETAGVCPQCTKHWEETSCHRCHAWSPHGEWYEEAGPQDP